MGKIPESDFTKAAHDLSYYLLALPLTKRQHKRLVSLILKQVDAAEANGFLQGLDSAKVIEGCRQIIEDGDSV